MATSTKLPYIIQPGMITKIFGKIREARSPDRFTQDFLQTKLGFKGGNYRQFIPLAKKLGLLKSDGTTTELYKSLRNPTTSKAAVAQATKNAYQELFERNEFAGSLGKEELKGLVVEITGLGSNDRVVNLICQTFEILKREADFESKLRVEEEGGGRQEDESGSEESEEGSIGVDLRLGYTINLVLPKTDDPAVFNAIFKSLRDNLLKR